MNSTWTLALAALVAAIAAPQAQAKARNRFECTTARCVSEVTVRYDGSTCSGEWPYDEVWVTRKPSLLVWKLKPADANRYFFDAAKGIRLTSANDGNQDISDKAADIGHDGSDRATFRRVSLNKRAARISFDFEVFVERSGSTPLKCSITDPMIINNG